MAQPTADVSEFDVEAAKRQLDAFLVQNPELEQLTATLAEFNIFDTLNITGHELRHSNTLAWLLDPSASHGLGDRFLRRFLSRLLLENRDIQTSLSAARIEMMDFGNIDVRREWQNIDIFVRSPANGWILLIENKINSKESAGQLLRYAETVRNEFPNDQLIPVFLTLDGETPSDEADGIGYVPLSHTHVLDVSESIFRHYEARVPQDAKVFLTHYLRVLRRITMQDEHLASLCKSIYRRHREAIDLIVQYGASSNVIESLEVFVGSLSDVALQKTALNRVWWMTKDVAANLREEELSDWTFLEKKYPVYWWVYYRTKADAIQLCLEVGPIADPMRRRQLLDTLAKSGFEFGKWAYDEGAKYTRVYSETKKLGVNEDGETDDSAAAVIKEAAVLWEKAGPKRKALSIAVKEWAKVPKDSA